MDKIIAIHQPSFFPWLGFFDKIVRSDIFVILDNVQYQKTGGYWANRVKLIVSGEAKWITMPIVRNYTGYRLINEMKINDNEPWREKMLRTIEMNYKKTPYFDEIYKLVNEFLNYKTDDLTSFNLNMINNICDLMSIDRTKMVMGSKLKASGTATEHLISIIKELQGNTYMCGGGAAKYQEDEMFEQNGIKLIYQNFQHPVYKQYGATEFIPGLSVIDALMNCGIDGTKKILNIS